MLVLSGMNFEKQEVDFLYASYQHTSVNHYGAVDSFRDNTSLVDVKNFPASSTNIHYLKIPLQPRRVHWVRLHSTWQGVALFSIPLKQQNCHTGEQGKKGKWY